MRRSRIPVVVSASVLVLANLLLYSQESASFEKAWRQFKSVGPLFSQGLKEFQDHRYESAAATFQKCIRKMPQHVDAHYYLANLFYIKADYEKALAHMEKSLAGFPFMRELDDYSRKEKNKAIDSYQDVIDQKWDYDPTCRVLRQLESLSEELSNEESNLESLARKKEAARARQKAHYLYFLGNILFQLKRFPEALGKYDAAIDLNPNHASAYNNAAAVRYLAGEHLAALGYLERAEGKGLEDNLNLKLKQLVYEALGRPTEGILHEDLSAGAENDLGVRRFALAFISKESGSLPLYENGYIVYSRRSRQAVLIDPGVEDPRIDDFVKTQGLEVKAVLNTHGHEDHVSADAYYTGRFGAPVGIHSKDSEDLSSPPGILLEEGKDLNYDGLAIRVVHTPGHTPGSICFVIGDFLFSGDTLLRNGLGKLGTEDETQMRKTREEYIRSIKEKLLTLPDRTRVCPGHGRMSTIAGEKADNPFLKK